MQQAISFVPGADSDADRAVGSVLDPEIETFHRLDRPFQNTRSIGCIPGPIGPFAGHDSSSRAILRAERAFLTEFLNANIYW